MKKKRPSNDILTWVLAALTIICSVLFVNYWRVGYSSDTVLTGLMAKNVIVRNERPIFLWQLGYHGVIPNVYVTALFFKLFGVGPRVNLLFTMLAWWALLFVVYRYIKQIWGRTIALCMSIALLASSCDFYTKVLRSEPGYTEAFLCGMLLLLLWHRAVAMLYVEQRPLDRTALLTLMGAGFFAGFGYYVYEMAIYFIALVAAQGACIALREAIRDFQWRNALDRLMAGLGAAGLLLVLDGIQAFVRKRPPFIAVQPGSLATVGLGLAVTALGLVVGLSKRHGAALVRMWPAAVAFVGGAIVGFSPRLYFRYVLHGQSTNRTGLDDNVDMFVQRLAWAWTNNKIYLNVHHEDVLSRALGMGWALVLVVFTVHAVRTWYAYVAGRTAREAILRLDPLSLLPWVVIPAFGLSAAVYNWLGSRYTMVLYFYYTLALAWVFSWFIENRKVWLRATGAALALLLIVFNGHQIVSDVQQREGDFEAEDVVQALKDHNIHYGYADYWAAYAITFFTDEDIILQPTYSAYAPAYGPIVAKADRLALVDKVQNVRARAANPWLNVNGRAMRVTDSFQGKIYGFQVLEAAPLPH